MEGLLALAAVFCAIAAAGGAMAGCLLARRPEKPATPPPPEEQRGHDLKLGEILWDTEKDYREYL